MAVLGGAKFGRSRVKNPRAAALLLPPNDRLAASSSRWFVTPSLVTPGGLAGTNKRLNSGTDHDSARSRL